MPSGLVTFALANAATTAFNGRGFRAVAMGIAAGAVSSGHRTVHVVDFDEEVFVVRVGAEGRQIEIHLTVAVSVDSKGFPNHPRGRRHRYRRPLARWR